MAKCSCIYKQQVLENVERMYEFHLQSFNKTLTVNLLEAKVSELQKNKEVFEKEVVKLNEKLEQLSKQMDKAKQAMDSVPKNRVERYNQNVTVYNNTTLVDSTQRYSQCMNSIVIRKKNS